MLSITKARNKIHIGIEILVFIYKNFALIIFLFFNLSPDIIIIVMIKKQKFKKDVYEKKKNHES